MWKWIMSWFCPTHTPNPVNRGVLLQDPLVGEYRRLSRFTDVYWRAVCRIGDLDYSVQLEAPGAKPTPAILEQFNTVLNKVKNYRDQELFVDIPVSRDPRLPPYCFQSAKVETLQMGIDGTIVIYFEYDGPHNWPYPTIEFDHNLNFVQAYWST